MDPLGTAGAATACTQLTEDDKVFAVLGFFQAPDVACYLQTHPTPIVGVSLTAQQSAAAKAAWFNNQISDSDLIPKEMAIFKQEGAFTGKKVGVVGTSADSAEMKLVGPALKKLKANVVQTAVNSVPDTDTTAQIAEYQSIAQKFQSSGVDVVVAVGNSGNGWPASLQDNQSTYTPRMIATDYNDLNAYVSNKAGVTQSILKNVLTAGPTPPAAVIWNDPAMKSCVATHQEGQSRRLHQQSGDGDGIDSRHLHRTGGRLPAGRALHGHREGGRQDPHRSDLRQGWSITDARDHPRRRRHLQLLGWPQRRERARVRLHVESVDQQAGAQDQRRVGTARSGVPSIGTDGQVETMATPAVPGAP